MPGDGPILGTRGRTRPTATRPKTTSIGPAAKRQTRAGCLAGNLAHEARHRAEDGQGEDGPEEEEEADDEELSATSSRSEPAREAGDGTIAASGSEPTPSRLDAGRAGE